MLAIAAVGVGCGAVIGVATTFGPTYCSDCTRTGQCASNLHNIALALLGHLDAQEVEKAFPSGTWPNASLPPQKRLSWYATIAPQLELLPECEALDKNQPWDEVSNAPFASKRISYLVCPDAFAPTGRHEPTQCIGIASVGIDAPLLPKGHRRAGVFGYDRRTALSDITDGATYTLMVAESARASGSWLAGGPATVRGLNTAELPYIGVGRQFGGLHRSRMCAAFADGSIRFLNDTINPRVLEALCTVAGGERLSY
jgi:hypothetical protein